MCVRGKEYGKGDFGVPQGSKAGTRKKWKVDKIS